MAKHHVRLTVAVEAENAEQAVQEFAMTLAEYGLLNWIFFVQNLETGKAEYVNRGGEELDEATLRYMQSVLDSYNATSEGNEAHDQPVDTSGTESLGGRPLETLASALLAEDDSNT